MARTLAPRSGSSDRPRRAARTAPRTASRDTAPAAPAAEERTPAPAPRAGRGGSGFSAWKKAVKQSGGDYNRFQVEEGEPRVVAFLDDGPFEITWVHWVPSATDDGRFVTVPRNCPTSRDDDADCPLCDRGIESKPVAYFNVVDLDEIGKVWLWEAGKDATGRIEKLFDELQGLPTGALELNDPDVYAVVSKEQQANKRYAYSVKRVKARDLDEDYALEPLAPEAREALAARRYDGSVIRFYAAEDLRKIADGLED